MSAPDRVTREREREALEHLRTQTEFWADQQGEGYVKINAGMAKRLIAALSTPQAGGEQPSTQEEAGAKCADVVREDDAGDLWIGFQGGFCPAGTGDDLCDSCGRAIMDEPCFERADGLKIHQRCGRLAPQVAQPDEGDKTCPTCGGPAELKYVDTNPPRWYLRCLTRDCDSDACPGERRTRDRRATPPVAGSREAAYGVLADAVTLLHSMAWTDVNGPRLNCRWCHTSADTPDHAGICPIAIVGNRIADGRATLQESRAEAAIARLRAPAPGTGGEETWEHPLDKELPEHVRPAWAVVREAVGESPLFNGTVSSALGVLRKAMRAPSEGTREPT